MSKENAEKTDPHIDLMFQQVYAKIADLKDYLKPIEKKIDELLAICRSKLGILKEVTKQQSELPVTGQPAPAKPPKPLEPPAKTEDHINIPRLPPPSELSADVQELVVLNKQSNGYRYTRNPGAEEIERVEDELIRRFHLIRKDYEKDGKTYINYFKPFKT